MMKIKTHLLITLAIPFLIYSCKKNHKDENKNAPAAQQQITINICNDPSTLDPRKARSLNDLLIIKQVMEGLMREDKSGKVTPAIAEKIEISTDQKSYTFTIRDSVWSNGEKITSHDFVHAWKKTLSPGFNAPNANMLYVIKNAKNVKTGNLPASMLGLDIPNENTLVVHLEEQTPFFLNVLSHPVFFPVNKNIDRANSKWADKASTYVCNGPFRLDCWEHNNFLKTKKNPTYWDHSSVSLDWIDAVMLSSETGLKMFESNDLSWDGSPLSTIPTDAIAALKKENKLQSSPVLGTWWLRVNVSKKGLSEKTLRKALAFSINRQEIVDHILQGNQALATGIVPDVMGLQSSPLFKDNDQETAKTLFSNFLNETGQDIGSLEPIPLLYSSSEKNHQIAQAIQDQWKKTLGVNVKLEAVESKVFFDRVSKSDFALSLGNWYADFDDAINFLEVFKSKDIGTNNTNWENGTYKSLIEKSYKTANLLERREIMAKSEKLLMDEMPVIPIYHATMLYVKKNNVKNVLLTRMGTIDFKWAYVGE